MLKLELQQDGLEEAIRDYIAKLGLSLEVMEMHFTAQRGNGGSILTELVLGNPTTVSNNKPGKAQAAETVKKDKPAPKVDEPLEEEKEEVVEEAPAKAGKSLFS